MTRFANIQAALGGEVGRTVLEHWRLAASKHAGTGEYASYLTPEQSIEYPSGGDSLAVAITNNCPHAAVLEDGHGGYHLPSVVNWGGPKVKTTSTGRRYLTIPFRHYSPGSASGGFSTMRERQVMPPAVYRAALRSVRAARDAGQSTAKLRLDLGRFGRPELFRRSANYRHMLQTTPGFPRRLYHRALINESQPGYTWRASKYAGMVRQEQQGSGGASSATYTTFRVMTEDSVGWYIPPFGGYHIAAEARDAAMPAVREILAAAAEQDVADMIQEILY